MREGSANMNVAGFVKYNSLVRIQIRHSATPYTTVHFVQCTVLYIYMYRYIRMLECIYWKTATMCPYMGFINEL